MNLLFLIASAVVVLTILALVRNSHRHTKHTEQTKHTKHTKHTERTEQIKRNEQTENTERTERVERAERTERVEQGERDLTVPPGSNLSVLGDGAFEFTASGETGDETLTLVIDGLRYPYQLKTRSEKIRVVTPRRVDLANVLIRTNVGNGKKIRFGPIFINDSNVDVRDKLFQVDHSPGNVVNGLVDRTGDISFHSQLVVIDPSTQANATLPTTLGKIEMAVSGNGKLALNIDGMNFPASGTYDITDGTKIELNTNRRVNLPTVKIVVSEGKVTLDAFRVDGEDVKSRIFRGGLLDNELVELRKTGGLQWVDTYTII
jgi:hypothetical protein